MLFDINSTCCFTGHRPNKLYGYDLGNSKYQVLAHKLARVIYSLHVKYGVDTFISGGALGFDTVAFFSVQYVKSKGYPVKNVLAIPFKGQEGRWNVESVDRYNRMLKLADEVIYVDTVNGYRGNYSIAKKLDIRNHYMVDNAKYIITAYDGSGKGGTYNCIKYAESHHKKIISVGI